MPDHSIPPSARPAKPAKRPAVMTGAAIPVLRWPPDEDRVEAIFERLSGVMPEPKTELDFSNPFTLVVAVALSAQATDVGVNKATAKLFPVARTPQAMLALGEAGVIPYIASIGLFRLPNAAIATARSTAARSSTRAGVALDTRA